MKSIFRYGVLLFVMAVLAFTPALNARAQGSCLPGLSADDCKLLADAEAQKVTSFAMDSWSVKLEVKGTGESDVSVDAKGNGAIDFSKVNVVAGKPESVAAGLKFLMTIDATATTAGKSEGGQAEIRIVDGVMYVKTDKTDWQKTDFAKVISQGSGAGAGMGLDPTTLGSLGSNPEIAKMAETLAAIPGLLTTEATDGPSVGGAATRQITLNVNLGALVTVVTSNQLPPDVSTALKAAGVDASTLTMLAGMFGPTLNSTKISVVQLVGKDDKMYHGLALNFSTTIGPEIMALAGGMGGAKTTPTAPQGPVSVSFAFDVKLTKINEAVDVQAVPNATDMSGSLSMPGLPALPGGK